MRTIQRHFSQGGNLATAMANRVETLGGRIDLISARWEIFKTRVGETSAFEPVNRFLGRIADLMDGNTASGQRFQATLDNLFKGLFGDLDKQDPAALFEKMNAAIQSSTPMLPNTWTDLSASPESMGTAATSRERL